MKLRKLLQGTVFTAALAVCMATGIMTVKAENGAFTDSGVNSVAIDTTKQTLTATGSNGELLVGVGKVNAKKQITVAAWDVYDGASAQTIDLSKLSNTKDNYIVLSANDKTEVSVVKIPAADKAISATFDASTGKLKVGTGAKASDAKSAAKEIDSDAYEYRTAYGSWTNLATASKAQVDLTTYQNQGATLYVRARGNSGTSATATSDTLSTPGTEELTYIDSAKKEHKVKVYDGKKLPSKEAKVNIAATAKGPSVAIDYVKGIVSLPKKSEWRAVNATAIKYDSTNKPIPVGDAVAKTNVADIFTKVNEASATKMTLEVRAVATEGKKAASKWTRVEIAKPVAIAANLLTAGNTADTKPVPPAGETKDYGGKGIAEAKVKEDAAKAEVLKITYSVVKKKDVIVIENSGDLTYEVVSGAADATKAPEDATAKKIAPKAKVTIPNVTDGSSVWIRVAGVKATKTWVGEYTKLGIVDYPKSVTTPAAS